MSGRTTLIKRAFALLLSCIIAVSPLFTLQQLIPQAEAATSLATHVYKEEVVPSYQFYLPTDFAMTPDGRIFVAEKSGKIKVIQNGTVLPQPFACTIKSSTDPETCAVTIAANRFGEQGLLGITLDPNFTSNHYIYIFYTNQSPAEYRVSRLTESNNQAVGGSEKILFSTPVDATAGTHFGGGLRFGPDGKIWFTTGEQENPTSSQDLNSYLGKLLRINPDGSIPSDNPFVGQTGKKPEIWSYGLRNPYRFSFLPDGRPILGDVGGDVAEEVDIAVKGGNFGWPTCEGPCTTSGMVNPTYTYYHTASASASIAGGMVYTGTQFPSQFQNKYFFGDYVRGYIHSIDLQNTSAGEQVLDAHAGSAITIQQGPDGSIYYLSIYPVGQLYRIYYSLDNQAPNAKIAADKTNGPLPLTIQFSSAGSNDPENDPITYKWDFGDGSTSTDPNPSHTYTTKGKYTATLVVNDGKLDSPKVSILIAAGYMPPSVTITSPLMNTHYNAGDTISYSAIATDPQDGTLPASAYSWTMRLHHLTHYHPFLGPITGVTSGTFVVPNNVEPSPDVTYDITLTVTDKDNLATTVTRTIYPNEITLTITSEPATNLQIDYNGITFATPYVTKAVVGYDIPLNAKSPVTGADGTQYVFSSWSDGGAQTHHITVPATDTTITAHYTPTVYTLSPGTTKILPPYTVVSGDVKVNGTPLYDNDPSTGLVIMLEQSASVSAQWGAVVYTNPDKTTGDATRQQVATQVKATGCGSSCTSVLSYDWPSGIPVTHTPYQIPAGQTVHVNQFTVVGGDISVNGTKLYDNDGSTGLVTKFEQGADITAPWGAQAINNTSETGAQNDVQAFVNDMKFHGCGSSCTSVTTFTYPNDLPTPTPTPYQIAAGATVHVPQYAVVSGDIKVNGTSLYDNDSTTGLVTKFAQAADVTAPWGAQAVNAANDTDANTQAQAFVTALKQHGCVNGAGCTSVQLLTWPQDAPTPTVTPTGTPAPLPSPRPAGPVLSATPNPLPQPRVSAQTMQFVGLDQTQALKSDDSYVQTILTKTKMTALTTQQALTGTETLIGQAYASPSATQFKLPETLVITYGEKDYDLMGSKDAAGKTIDLTTWKQAWEAFYTYLDSLHAKPIHIYVTSLGLETQNPAKTGKLPAGFTSAQDLADKMDQITKDEAQKHNAIFIDIRSGMDESLYQDLSQHKLNDKGNAYVAHLLLSAMGIAEPTPTPTITPPIDEDKSASPSATPMVTPTNTPAASPSASPTPSVAPLPSPRNSTREPSPTPTTLPVATPTETPIVTPAPLPTTR